MSADEFFIGAMVTAAMPAIALREVRFRSGRKSGVGSAFHEVRRAQIRFRFRTARSSSAVDEAGNWSKRSG